MLATDSSSGATTTAVVAAACRLPDGGAVA
jgi:hypothetical protein